VAVAVVVALVVAVLALVDIEQQQDFLYLQEAQ
jgi:hypothetical protein